MLTKLIVLLVIVLLVFLGLRTYMPRFGSSVATGIQESAGLQVLGDCSEKPNCQCSEALRTSQRVDRFPVTQDEADSAIATIVSIINEQPGMQVVTQDDRYLHATHTSSLMRYVDDIEFLLSDDNLSLQVRSASRLGNSDLGANTERVRILREAYTKKQ